MTRCISGGTGSGGGRCDVDSGNREGDVEDSNIGVNGIGVVRTVGNSGFVGVANDGAASAWALVSELAQNVGVNITFHNCDLIDIVPRTSSGNNSDVGRFSLVSSTDGNNSGEAIGVGNVTMATTVLAPVSAAVTAGPGEHRRPGAGVGSRTSRWRDLIYC